jgi:hypothetical protein
VVTIEGHRVFVKFGDRAITKDLAGTEAEVENLTDNHQEAPTVFANSPVACVCLVVDANPSGCLLCALKGLLKITVMLQTSDHSGHDHLPAGLLPDLRRFFGLNDDSALGCLNFCKLSAGDLETLFVLLRRFSIN